MAVKYDPILGKVVSREIDKEEIDRIRKEVSGKAPLHHTHSIADINDMPVLEFASDEDIQTLFT